MVEVGWHGSITVVPSSICQALSGGKAAKWVAVAHAQTGEVVIQFQVRSVLRKYLRDLGLQDKYFSTHSFRIGAATEAFQKGLGPNFIKKLGRWESSCFKRYIRPDQSCF